MNLKTHLIAFDLDGTLRKPASEGKFIQHPHDQLPIDGTIEMLEYIYFKYPDAIVVGITNQGGVSAGYKSLRECKIEQLITMIAFYPLIDTIVYCPDDGCTAHFLDLNDEDDNSEILSRNITLESPVPIYRKPDTGMFEAVRKSVEIPKDNCIFVGDMESDRIMAETAGISYYDAADFRENYKELLLERF